MNPRNLETAWDDWEQGRRPVAGIIDELLKEKEGPITMLDYGCANGLFLFSTQRWSEHDIEPFGYDTDKKRISAARELFPQQSMQFATKGKLESLPASFDIVFWNLWDNWHFLGPDREKRLGLFRNLLERSGHLILGLYDKDPKERQRKLKELAGLGYEPLGTRDSATGHETFAWFKGTGEPEIAVDNYR